MTTTAHDEGGIRPPRLLQRSATPDPAPPPISRSEPMAQIHRRWAQLHGVAPEASAGAGPPGRGDRAEAAAPRIPGVRAKVRARVATAAAGVQQAERAMTGDLVRAVDALATRVDEVTTRLTELEALVQEVVDTVSEDLVRVQAALARPEATPRDPEPGDRTPPGGPTGSEAPQ